MRIRYKAVEELTCAQHAVFLGGTGEGAAIEGHLTLHRAGRGTWYGLS